MASSPETKYKPTLIIHGGAGALSRSAITPDLYDQYHTSLLTYLRSTRKLLETGYSALDAAVHAVSLLEDDELFNCARGSVFTSTGTIEMEASVMVTSIYDPDKSSSDGMESNPSCSTHQCGGSSNDSIYPGSIKRGVGVIGLKNVRHPIQLAREVLLRTGLDKKSDGGNMHAQLSGSYAEDLARLWDLKFEPDEYFWTQRRWDEHLRKQAQQKRHPPTEVVPDPDHQHRKYHGLDLVYTVDPLGQPGSSSIHELPSGPEIDLNALPQGTVGCVCLDQYGNLAVATSTGGMTNKVPGRVGDTPTLGAGFWAERWDASPATGLSALPRQPLPTLVPRPLGKSAQEDEVKAARCGTGCLPSFSLRRRRRKPSSPFSSSSSSGHDRVHPRYIDKATQRSYRDIYTAEKPDRESLSSSPLNEKPSLSSPTDSSRASTTSLSSLPPYQPLTTNPSPPAMVPKAIALSGTGNGDSFLRVCAARTVSAMARFSSSTSLSDAVTAVAGPGGELQRSAGNRWGSGEGEGEGGMIGIEVEDSSDSVNGENDGRIRGKVVWDFNCGGMWRAWIDADHGDKEMVMVFRESYY